MMRLKRCSTTLARAGMGEDIKLVVFDGAFTTRPPTCSTAQPVLAQIVYEMICRALADRPAQTVRPAAGG